MTSVHKNQAEYVVIIPAYNEAQSIGRALDALQDAINHTPHHLRRVVICLNGCTDETERVIATKNNATLKISVIRSKKGYRNALNHLFKHTKRHFPDARIVKLDADAIVRNDAIAILLDQLAKHPRLQIIGGHPLPLISPTLNLIQKLFARTFSLRYTYPLSQVASYDVRRYHALASRDPQPGIGNDEKRLKIYFHGRIWAAKSSAVLSNISDTVIGDDIFLASHVYHTYGPGSIRVMYNANVLCAPNHNLKRHWKVYRRIHEDKLRVEAIPEFTAIQLLQKTQLDWSYILSSTPLYDRVLFMLYGLITWAEEISFKRTKYRDSYWQYKQKESL